MTSDILKRAADAVEKFSMWDVIPYEDDPLVDGLLRDIAAARTLIPDMAAAIAERDAEIERLTARAEAAEAMADRLAEALKNTSDAHMSLAHDSYDGCWTIEDFDSESAVATEALAAYAAMKEGTSTLSPIAAAARVLLTDPDTFDGFRGYILNRNELGVSMSDYAEGAMDYLRALAEQEKADG